MEEAQNIQIIKDRFYFCISNSTPKNIPNGLCFNTDMDLKYKCFRKDFGPLNIACIHKYTNKLENILSDDRFANKIFIHQTSTDYKKNTNAALLVCAAMIILFQQQPQQIWSKFKICKLRAFRDASEGECSYLCTIIDCLKGLQYAIKLGWYDYSTFNLQKYQYYDQMENGYLNWIIPGKFAACSMPYDERINQKNNISAIFRPNKKALNVTEYSKIFQSLGINGVIKLNQQNYDEQIFINHGIQHYDLRYDDGTKPPMKIVQQFLSITEKQKAYAVHCAAGLGRTGSLIACYAMKHYNFSAAQFIGWIRLCRPGSILGPQQHFLLDIENQMKALVKQSKVWRNITIQNPELCVYRLDLKDQQRIEERKMSEDQTYICKYGDKGQGGKLLNLKSLLGENINTVDTDID